MRRDMVIIVNSLNVRVQQWEGSASGEVKEKNRMGETTVLASYTH